MALDPTNRRPDVSRVQKAQLLMDLVKDIAEERNAEARESFEAIDLEKIRAMIGEEMKKQGVFRIEVRNRNQQLGALEGHHHPMFPTLCRMAGSFGRDGYVPGIYIAGEASSGKSHATKKLADVLQLPFGFNGAISQPHEMLGFIDGMGNYHTTPFRKIYEHGGVYCFDEVDRSDPNALLAVNPHLANGVAEFPDGQIKRHPDAIIICTANTWGTGANAEYVGANKLDAAFLSRFPMRLRWNIDETFERNIVGNDLWVARIQAARKRARAAGIKVMIDTRCALAGAAMIEAGFTHDEAATQTYLGNVTPEQVKMIEPDMSEAA